MVELGDVYLIFMGIVSCVMKFSATGNCSGETALHNAVSCNMTSYFFTVLLYFNIKERM